MFAVLTLAAFWIGCGCPFSEIQHLAENSHELHRGETMAFLVLALCQIVQSFNMRSDKSLFKVGFFKNRTLNLAALFALVSTLFVALVPGVQDAFGLEPLLSIEYYLICLGLVLVPLVVMEFAKLVGFIKHKH